MLTMQENNQRGSMRILRRVADGSLQTGSAQPSVGAENSQTPKVEPLRNRFKKPEADNHDIGDVWQTQDMIRKQEQARRRMLQTLKRARRKKRIKRVVQSSSAKVRATGTALKVRPRRISKSVYAYGIIGVVLIGGAVSVATYKYKNDTGPAVASDSSAVASATSDSPVNRELPVEKPSYKILYPGGDEARYINTVRRKSPDGQPPAYGFNDTVGGIGLNVNQQKLPDSFLADTAGSVDKMAREFQATNSVSIGEDKVYYGWSEKSGVQSIILAKNKLLLLIRAERQLTEQQIVEYIRTLK